LNQLEQGSVSLEIADNGIGVPAAIDLHNLKSLGMRIIFGIAGHQLHARVQVDTSEGVRWHILLPELSAPLESETPYMQ
jgi:two-component sensor histidine kinase